MDLGLFARRITKSMSMLWDFLESQLVWKLLLRIFANYIPPSIYTWGMVVWISLVPYDVKSLDHTFRTCFRTVCVVPLVTVRFLGRKEGDATSMGTIGHYYHMLH